jgi:hypothetical protein
MTLNQIVNPTQRWRIAMGSVPDCPVGSTVSLATNGYRLEVSRPWFGVVAHLDLRTASIQVSGDGRELTIGTAAGEVVFQNEAAATPGLLAPPAPAPRPDAASFVGSVVQFGAIAPNADGWNLFVFLVLRRVNGWLIGLTQNGHPAGIAESNIAWANVLDPGPRHASDRLVLSYVGTHKECLWAYQAEAPTLGELGYQVSNQEFSARPRRRFVPTAGLSVLTVTLQRLPGSP